MADKETKIKKFADDRYFIQYEFKFNDKKYTSSNRYSDKFPNQRNPVELNNKDFSTIATGSNIKIYFDRKNPDFNYYEKRICFRKHLQL